MKAQHLRFANLVRDGMKQGKAAIEAGFSPASANTQASLLMKRQDVKDVIRGATTEELEAAAIVTGINARFILSQIFNIAQDAKAQKKPDYKSALTAFGMLGKHLGLFIDRTEITNVNQVKDYLDKIIDIMDEEVRDPATRARIMERLLTLKASFD